MTKTKIAALLVAVVMTASFANAPAVAQTPAPAAAPADKTAPPKIKARKPPTPGQLAARERAKKCGAEWKEAKAAGKIQAGMKWPQYWSACNKRLKGAA
jgi:hypothetical protein